MSEIKKLWHFRQNNSGGRYTGPAYNLIVEADSASEIKSRDHIIYLDTAMEDRTYTCGNFPLVYGCPEWRRGEFRVSMEFENFAK
jgi:hypothetical protein